MANYYYVNENEMGFSKDGWEQVQEYMKKHYGIKLNSVDRLNMQCALTPKFLELLNRAREELAELEAGESW